MDVVIGETYSSTKYGDFIVLEYIGKDKNHAPIYKIQFLNSTCIIIANKYQITHGRIRDPWHGINMNIIQYSNNYGPFKVLNIYSGTIYTKPTADIQFINTGTTKTIVIDYIKTGCIQDENIDPKTIPPLDTTLLQPNIREIRINQMLRVRHHKMIAKCTKPEKDNTYKIYGARGVTVCDRWLDVDTFLSDVRLLSQFEKFYRYPTMYELDKDYKQLHLPINQRIYSPETCMFLHFLDNENILNYELKQRSYSKDQINISKYFGVRMNPKTKLFSVIINIYPNGHYYFGTYTNEIAAANAYNYHYKVCHFMLYPRYEIFPLLNNNIPYMSLEEFSKYIVKSRQIYHLNDYKLNN